MARYINVDTGETSDEYRREGDWAEYATGKDWDGNPFPEDTFNPPWVGSVNRAGAVMARLSATLGRTITVTWNSMPVPGVTAEETNESFYAKWQKAQADYEAQPHVIERRRKAEIDRGIRQRKAQEKLDGIVDDLLAGDLSDPRHVADKLTLIRLEGDLIGVNSRTSRWKKALTDAGYEKDYGVGHPDFKDNSASEDLTLRYVIGQIIDFAYPGGRSLANKFLYQGGYKPLDEGYTYTEL